MKNQLHCFPRERPMDPRIDAAVCVGCATIQRPADVWWTGNLTEWTISPQRCSDETRGLSLLVKRAAKANEQ